MTCVFTARQFQAFLADPAFWGQGQSYENLRLLINGKPCGYTEFKNDWDPEDLNLEDFVQILEGVWHGNGYRLPSHQMADVIEHWSAGDKPEKVKSNIQAKSKPETAKPVACEPLKVQTPKKSAVSRPTFNV